MVSVSKPSAGFLSPFDAVCHFDQKKTSVNETRTLKLILQQLANNLLTTIKMRGEGGGRSINRMISHTIKMSGLNER